MEHITDIDKTAHLEECVEAVREIINPDDYGLTEEALYALTKEIMDTSLTMGGDFHLDNIRFFAERFLLRVDQSLVLRWLMKMIFKEGLYG